MKTIETICAHQVEFWYDSKSPNAVPDESEIEHVQELIIDNCVEGELCMTKHIRNRYYDFGGWWKIIRGAGE